jgi:hypothetical protein
MLTAVENVLQAHWAVAAPFAESEMKKLSVTAAQIETGYATGGLSDEQGRILLRMQANASQAALTAIETIGMIAAQDAINAALAVLKDAVNKAVGAILV